MLDCEKHNTVRTIKINSDSTKVIDQSEITVEAFVIDKITPNRALELTECIDQYEMDMPSYQATPTEKYTTKTFFDMELIKDIDNSTK